MEQIDLALQSEAIQSAIDYTKANPETYLGRILKFFLKYQGKWLNKSELHKIFTNSDPHRDWKQYYAGLNWDRRLREAVAKDWIEHERDPDQKNQTYRYRMPL